MRDEHRPMVLDSWLSSTRDSEFGAKSLPHAFYAAQRRLAERMLSTWTVRIARPTDWPEGLAAWCCARADASEFVLGWSYVKRDYRRVGLGWELMRQCGYVEQPRRVFTFPRKPGTKVLERHGFVYERAAARKGRE